MRLRTATFQDFPLLRHWDAQRFCERLGLRFVEDRIFDGDPCAIYRLERAEWLRARAGLG